jgi:hypothetical protein
MRIVEFDLGFEPHDKLNPALWQGEDLLPDVKSALVKIAEDFKKYIDVPFDVEDLVITGGQVSYYYTKHSDLDLHLVVDFDSVACDREAAELFDTKRLLYKNRYSITVKGIPVELYVEDERYPAVSSSYSLFSNSWLKRPEMQNDTIDLKEIERMSAVWQKIIDASLTSNDVKTAKKTLDLLRNYRKLGLKQTGEYGVQNLVYKTLRNSKTLEKLITFIDDMHEKDLSI